MIATAAVSTAFAFGWQMARLYEGPLRTEKEPEPGDDLPGLSDLSAARMVALGLDQADAALRGLREFVPDATLPTTDEVRQRAGASKADSAAIRQAIFDLHIELLTRLTAADYRLGKAYGLGRALADTCASGEGDTDKRKAALEHHLQRNRAGVIIEWLDDLKTVLPDHAAQSVSNALHRWVYWTEKADLTRPDIDVNKITRLLHRDGQRWRAVLSGEKDAKDLLDIDDYVTVARGAFLQTGKIVQSLIRCLKVPLTVAAALLGVGIWLIIANDGAAQVIAGLGTVASGLGITWRSTAGALRQPSVDLFKPLWDAQIDINAGNKLAAVCEPARRSPLPWTKHQ